MTWGVTTDSGSSGGSVRHPGRLEVLRSGRNRSELNPKMQILSFVLKSQLGINTVGYPYLHHVTQNSGKWDPTEKQKCFFFRINDFRKNPVPKLSIRLGSKSSKTPYLRQWLKNAIFGNENFRIFFSKIGKFWVFYF